MEKNSSLSKSTKMMFEIEKMEAEICGLKEQIDAIYAKYLEDSQEINCRINVLEFTKRGLQMGLRIELETEEELTDENAEKGLEVCTQTTEEPIVTTEKVQEEETSENSSQVQIPSSASLVAKSESRNSQVGIHINPMRDSKVSNGSFTTSPTNVFPKEWLDVAKHPTRISTEKTSLVVTFPREKEPKSSSNYGKTKIQKSPKEELENFRNAVCTRNTLFDWNFIRNKNDTTAKFEMTQCKLLGNLVANSEEISSVLEKKGFYLEKLVKAIKTKTEAQKGFTSFSILCLTICHNCYKHPELFDIFENTQGFFTEVVGEFLCVEHPYVFSSPKAKLDHCEKLKDGIMDLFYRRTQRVRE